MRRGRAAWWLAPLLAAPLGACRSAPVTAGPVTARPAATVPKTGASASPGAMTVICDTPAGPLTRTLNTSSLLPGTCDTGIQAAFPVAAPAPAAPGTRDADPAASELAASGPGAGREPATSAGAPSVTGGVLTVTPDLIHLGEREFWTVTADLRSARRRLPPDGTLVTLTGRGASGEQVRATRLTVGGVARWHLTPVTAGPFTFTATSGAWTARVSGLARSGLLGGRPQAIFTGQQVILGPLRWADGALPDDGTPVYLSALNRAGRTVWSAIMPVTGGQVQADVPRVQDAVTLRAELAGSAVSFAWR